MNSIPSKQKFPTAIKSDIVKYEQFLGIISDYNKLSVKSDPFKSSFNLAHYLHLSQ